MSLIPAAQYIEIMKVLPILCADIVVRNSRGEYLLVKRDNEPLKDHWWVLGGRVLKGETMEEAARRKVKQETGLSVKELRPLGYFELVEGANPVGQDFSYHSASVVFSAEIDGPAEVTLDKQSLEYKFAKELPAGLVIKPFGGEGRE